MSTPTALVKVMIGAARKAGRALARDFGEVAELQVSKKGAADYVSAADLKAEQTVFEELLRARPGYGFLGEERGMVEGTDKTHTWIVDPLDGTTNFLHAMPHFAINIALQREGTIVAAVTYNPANSDLFWAERGRGAYLNDRRLRVAARTRFEEAVIATGIPFMGHGQHGRFLMELHQITQRVSGVRRFGAAALDLAWVAAGRFDAFWERDLNAWDMAAGILLVTEAGGRVTDADGGEDPLVARSVCAGNSVLQSALLERIRAADPSSVSKSDPVAVSKSDPLDSLAASTTNRPMNQTKLKGQRELTRELLLKYGHDRRRVCAAYAAADRRGEVRRVSDVTGRTSESYATEVWASGHRPSDRWIEEFCQQHGIPL